MEYQRELAFGFPLTRGQDVSVVQLALTALRTPPPCGDIDGVYGDWTRQSVMQFQRANGLPVDGVVGSKTWRELVEKAEHKNAPSAFLKMAAGALPQNDYPLTRA